MLASLPPSSRVLFNRACGVFLLRCCFRLRVSALRPPPISSAFVMNGGALTANGANAVLGLYVPSNITGGLVGLAGATLCTLCVWFCSFGLQPMRCCLLSRLKRISLRLFCCHTAVFFIVPCLAACLLQAPRSRWAQART